MKRTLIFAALLIAAPCYAQENADQPTTEDGAVKLIYPIEAAENVKIDSSATLNRILPPTLEEAEVDPVTPLGQIRNVLENLDAVKKSQQETQDQVKNALKGFDVSKIETRLTDATNERFKLGEQLQALRTAREEDASALKNIVGTLSTIGAAKSKLSKVSDYCSIVVFLYIAIKILSMIAGWVSTLSSAMNERIMAKAVEKAKEELMSKGKN